MLTRTITQRPHLVRLSPLVLVAAIGWYMTQDWEWALPLISCALALCVSRWSLLVVLVQALLLVAAAREFSRTANLVQLATLLSLFELTWRPRREIAVGTVAVGVATVFNILALQAVPEPPPVLAAVIAAAFVTAAPVLLGLHRKSLREAAYQAQQRAMETEKRLEVERRESAANERVAISRELHDQVAHHVASIVLRVGVARHVAAGADPELREVLDDVHGSGTAALQDLRRLVGVLRDPRTIELAQPLVGPTGLVESLNAIVRRTRQSGMAVSEQFDAGLDTLDAVRWLAVLRIAQEALTNAIKHAGPQANAWLWVRMLEDGTVEVEVLDNGGSGVVPATPGGHGLVGMRERVELLSGALTVGPAEGGWRVRAVLPPIAGERW